MTYILIAVLGSGFIFLSLVIKLSSELLRCCLGGVVVTRMPSSPFACAVVFLFPFCGPPPPMAAIRPVLSSAPRPVSKQQVRPPRSPKCPST